MRAGAVDARGHAGLCAGGHGLDASGARIAGVKPAGIRDLRPPVLRANQGFKLHLFLGVPVFRCMWRQRPDMPARGTGADPHCLNDPHGLATAQQLFAVLRDFDAQGVKLIWVESPPEAVEWDGVRDRLGRAAAS